MPLALLREPFSSGANRAEKYLDIQPAAAFAATILGQDDEATVATLMRALEDGSDQPRWLTGDLVGALSALTGQRLGYDVGAWHGWWRDRSPD